MQSFQPQIGGDQTQTKMHPVYDIFLFFFSFNNNAMFRLNTSRLAYSKEIIRSLPVPVCVSLDDCMHLCTVHKLRSQSLISLLMMTFIFFFLLCSLPFIYYLRSVGKVKEQCSRSVVLAYYIVSIYAAMDPVLPSDGCIHTTHIHMRTAHTQNTLFCSGGARRPATPPPTPPLTVW